jgi:hypothetical protein
VKIVKLLTVLFYILGLCVCASDASEGDKSIIEQELRAFVRTVLKERWPELQDDRAIRLENYWVEVSAVLNPEIQQRGFLLEQIRYYFGAVGSYLHQADGIDVIETFEGRMAKHIEALNAYPSEQVLEAFIQDHINRQNYITEVLIRAIDQAGSVATGYRGPHCGMLWFNVRNAEWMRMVGKGFGSDEIAKTENQLAYENLLFMIGQLYERYMADVRLYARNAYKCAIHYNLLHGEWMPWEQHKELIDREIAVLNLKPFVLSKTSDLDFMLLQLSNSLMGFGMREYSNQQIMGFRRDVDEMQTRFRDNPEDFVVFCKDATGPFLLERDGWRITDASGHLVDGNSIGRGYQAAFQKIRREPNVLREVRGISEPREEGKSGVSGIAN